jgi:oxygen-independent coproporphyrinogen III oxidase
LTATFDFTPLQEHAIELDPRRLDAALVSTLARIHITRASLGVQDFSPHLQQAIGRLQPFAQVEQAVAALRAAGIANINIDLMYGLPRQTIGDAIRSAELAASLKPARLALFGYAHVPWLKPHQRLIDEAALPGAGERMAQMHAAARLWRNAATYRSALITSDRLVTTCGVLPEPGGCTAIFRVIRRILRMP